MSFTKPLHVLLLTALITSSGALLAEEPFDPESAVSPTGLSDELARIQRSIALEQAKQKLLEAKRARQALEGGLPQLPTPSGPPALPGSGTSGNDLDLGLRGGPTTWRPVGIYGASGQLKARVQSADGTMMAEVKLGDTLPDGTRVMRITADKVSFNQGKSEWTAGLVRYADEKEEGKQ